MKLIQESRNAESVKQILSPNTNFFYVRTRFLQMPEVPVINLPHLISAWTDSR